MLKARRFLMYSLQVLRIGKNCPMKFTPDCRNGTTRTNAKLEPESSGLLQLRITRRESCWRAMNSHRISSRSICRSAKVDSASGEEKKFWRRATQERSKKGTCQLT